MVELARGGSAIIGANPSSFHTKQSDSYVSQPSFCILPIYVETIVISPILCELKYFHKQIHEKPLQQHCIL